MFGSVLSALTTPIGLFVVTGICMLVGLLYMVHRPATSASLAPLAPPASPVPISLNTSVPEEPLTKEEFETLLTLIGFKVKTLWFSVLGMNDIDDGCGHMSPIIVIDDEGNEVVRGGFENDMKYTINAAKLRLDKQTKMHKKCMTAISNYRKGVETTFQTIVDGKETIVSKTILMVSGFNNWMAFTLLPGIVIFIECSWQVSPDDLVDDEIYDLSNKDVIVKNVAYDPADIKMIRKAYEMVLLTQQRDILAKTHVSE